MSLDYQALRDSLKTELADLLGNYIWPDGSTTPAIALDYGNHAYPPKGTGRDGLEVVIVARADIPMRPLTGGAWQETYMAQIVLKQWDTNQNCLAAFDRAFSTVLADTQLALVGDPVRVQPIEELNNIESASFAIAKVAIRCTPSHS